MNIKVWGESMAYIENIVIGTPIVDPKDMFASDEDDWDGRGENLLYRREISSEDSCRIRYLSINQ